MVKGTGLDQMSSIADIRGEVTALKWTVGVIGSGLIALGTFNVNSMLTVKQDIGNLIGTSKAHQDSLVKIESKLTGIESSINQILIYQKASLDIDDASRRLAENRRWRVFASKNGKEFINTLISSLPNQRGVIVFENYQTAKSVKDALESVGSASLSIRDIEGRDGIVLGEAVSWNTIMSAAAVMSENEPIEFYLQGSADPASLNKALTREGVPFAEKDVDANFAILK